MNPSRSARLEAWQTDSHRVQRKAPFSLLLLLLGGSLACHAENEGPSASQPNQVARNLDVVSDCVAPDRKQRVRLQFSQETPRLQLAEAMVARAICVKLTSGIKGVEIFWSMNSWPLAEGDHILAPSFQYLDQQGRMIQTMARPSKSQTRVGGNNLTMHNLTALRGDLERARYLVIYVDSLNLQGSTRAMGAYGAREIPHTDVGRIEIQLH